MSLKCKDGKCDNVYLMEFSGAGKDFVGQVVVVWKCGVCGMWNVFVKGKIGGCDGV